MDDMYEAVFRWPYESSNTVILTGTFDQWSKSMTLIKGPSGFEGRVRIPWGAKVAYKFIVDGNWTTVDGQPLEPDPIGNWNNVYTAPPKPIASAEPTSISDEIQDTTQPLETSPITLVSSAPESPPVNTDHPDADSKAEITQTQPPASEAGHGHDHSVDSSVPPTDSAAVAVAIHPQTERPASPGPPIAHEPTTSTMPPQLDTLTELPLRDTQKTILPIEGQNESVSGTAPASSTLGKKAGKAQAPKQVSSSSAGEDSSAPSTSRFSSKSFREKRNSFLLKLRRIFTHDQGSGNNAGYDNKAEEHDRRTSVAQ